MADEVMPAAAARRWATRFLGIPLELKLLGANLIIVAIAMAVMWTQFSIAPIRTEGAAILGIALVVAAGVNFGLVRLALQPVKDLELTARRVSQGRFGARVPPSAVADPALAHLAVTMNEMLDTIAESRDRMRRIGANVMLAHERERAELARGLHDSLGQTLAAASFQIASAASELGSGNGSTQLFDARELLRSALEEIRNVSRTLYPRVADDLGLPRALQALADATRQRSLIEVSVDIDLRGAAIPTPVATTLYRVAQEALRNVEQHSDAGTATVTLRARRDIVEIEIRDDGCGFETATERRSRDTAMSQIQQRLSLAGGELHIDSTRDSGTRVTARIGLEAEAA